MSNRNQFLPRWILIGAAILCFVAVADVPYGFYELVRWVACGVAIAAAIQMHEFNHTSWVWILGFVALIFNPLIPFSFPKSIWMVLDAGAGVCFLATFRITNPNNKNG